MSQAKQNAKKVEKVAKAKVAKQRSVANTKIDVATDTDQDNFILIIRNGRTCTVQPVEYKNRRSVELAKKSLEYGNVKVMAMRKSAYVEYQAKKANIYKEALATRTSLDERRKVLQAAITNLVNLKNDAENSNDPGFTRQEILDKLAAKRGELKGLETKAKIVQETIDNPLIFA